MKSKSSKKNRSNEKKKTQKLKINKNLSKEDNKILEINDHTKHENNEENEIKKEEKEEDKNIIKPREDFLKKKINDMKINKNILNGVSNGLNQQLKYIEDDIDDNQILITEVSKNLNNLIKNDNNNNNKNNQLNLIEKKNYLHIIKELNKNKLSLEKNLLKLEESEKLLNNELYSSLDKQKNLIDENIKEEKLKNIKKKKQVINERISNINLELNSLISKDFINNKETILKKYIENFEKDKENAEKKIKEFKKQSEKLKIKYDNDINKIIDKRNKDFENKEEQILLEKNDYLKKLKEKEKELRLKRKEKNNEIINKYKSFKTEKTKSLKNYFFIKSEDKFQLKENILLKKEKNKRKEHMRHITSEEIKEFSDKFEKFKNEKNIENNEKIKLLQKDWNNRKKLLPKFVSNFQKNYDNENKINNFIEKENNKKKLLEIKKDFCDKLQIPQINEHLKSLREEKIKNLTDRYSYDKNYSSNNIKNLNKKLLLKLNENKNNYKWEIKNNEEIKKEILLKNEIKKNLIKKPKKINLSQHIIHPKKNKSELPIKKIDYLTEFRNKTIENEELKEIKINTKKWEKLLKNEDQNIITNINIVKNKADLLEEKALREQQLLKMNGGIKNNPILGQKVSNYLIDSIEAKLSILKKFAEINHEENN